MANYNLFENIDTGSMTSAANTLRTKLKASQTKLGTFQGSLNDKIWKANSKATLLKAFTTIDGEVYPDILANLDKIDQAAACIAAYRKARDLANQYRGYINNATEGTTQGQIDSWASSLREQEAIMDENEQKVKGL